MSCLRPTDKHLLFTKNDKEDPRLGETICLLTDELNDPAELTQKNLPASDYFILGYPDDEGISLNGGRVGAYAAPAEIRKFLYKMTPHPKTPVGPRILDLGDVTPNGKTLAERHETGRSLVGQIVKTGKSWLSFGGGHDYGYCDSTGFLDTHSGNAVIINFDAHMDVRPVDKGFNSGTPFYRLLTEFFGRVDFAEFGIQNQCNSRFHMDWAQKQGADIFSLDRIQQRGLLPTLQEYLKDKAHKKIFLSVDIDAFTSNEAPGCSQSWTTGLNTREFMPSLQWMIQNHDVCGMGIYEVSPALDEDHRTCKLAALLAHQFIFSMANKDRP